MYSQWKFCTIICCCKLIINVIPRKQGWKKNKSSMSNAVYNYVKMQVQMQSNQIRLTVSYYLNKPLLRVRKQTCTISLSVLPQQSFQQLSVTWIWNGKCSRTYQKQNNSIITPRNFGVHRTRARSRILLETLLKCCEAEQKERMMHAHWVCGLKEYYYK